MIPDVHLNISVADVNINSQSLLFCHYSHLTSTKGMILPQIFRAFFAQYSQLIQPCSQKNLIFSAQKGGRNTPLTLRRSSTCWFQSYVFVHIGPWQRKDYCRISSADLWRHPRSLTTLFSVPTETTYLVGAALEMNGSLSIHTVIKDYNHLDYCSSGAIL